MVEESCINSEASEPRDSIWKEVKTGGKEVIILTEPKIVVIVVVVDDDNDAGGDSGDSRDSGNDVKSSSSLTLETVEAPPTEDVTYGFELVFLKESCCVDLTEDLISAGFPVTFGWLFA